MRRAISALFREVRRLQALRPPFPASGDRLDAITVDSESNGRRYGANGDYLRSPAGAMGEWQVMPATARAPGFGVRPWNGSPDDLARVGRDYRRAMERRYSGDPARMWAAYNAGPGRVDGALRGGGNWLRRLPPETQSYVTRNMARLRGP
jgi:soluble lytic murein transglycosylase